MTKDNLIDLITIGIARSRIQRERGEEVDMAEVIADILIENNYCKASEVTRKVFEEIEKRANIGYETPIGKYVVVKMERYIELKKKCMEEINEYNT